MHHNARNVTNAFMLFLSKAVKHSRNCLPDLKYIASEVASVMNVSLLNCTASPISFIATVLTIYKHHYQFSGRKKKKRLVAKSSTSFASPARPVPSSVFVGDP